MIISWRYSQSVKLLEYDLCYDRIYFEAISGQEFDGFSKEELYVEFDNYIPDINRIIELIEEKFNLYLCD